VKVGNLRPIFIKNPSRVIVVSNDVSNAGGESLHVSNAGM
jgi:hypothetical protein